MTEVLAAASELAQTWQVCSDVFSVTSYSELARQARELQRRRIFGMGDDDPASHVATLLGGGAPVVAATDYVRAVPQQIAEYVTAPFTTLGTDGFGRSDTRAALRAFFDVDRHAIVLAALTALHQQGQLDATRYRAAIAKYASGRDICPPWLQ